MAMELTLQLELLDNVSTGNTYSVAFISSTCTDYLKTAEALSHAFEQNINISQSLRLDIIVDLAIKDCQQDLDISAKTCTVS